MGLSFEVDSSKDRGKYQISDLRSQIAQEKWVGLSLEVEPNEDQGKSQISDIRSQLTPYGCVRGVPDLVVRCVFWVCRFCFGILYPNFIRDPAE